MVHVFLFRTMLHTVLPLFAKACKASPPNECLLNLTVKTLARHSEEFQNADYCTLIFDKFLFSWLFQESVLRHSLRLMWFVQNRIEANRMVQLLTATQPTPQVSYLFIFFHLVLFNIITHIASQMYACPLCKWHFAGRHIPGVPKSCN